jgi:hypothetical protein
VEEILLDASVDTLEALQAPLRQVLVHGVAHRLKATSVDSLALHSGPRPLCTEIPCLHLFSLIASELETHSPHGRQNLGKPSLEQRHLRRRPDLEEISQPVLQLLISEVLLIRAMRHVPANDCEHEQGTETTCFYSHIDTALQAVAWVRKSLAQQAEEVLQSVET